MSSRPESTKYQTNIVASFRPLYQEITFISTVEPLIDSRPLVVLFIMDASHSMRFYIQKRKKIQRQTLVQSAIKVALVNRSILQDGDYVGLATFSTDAKSLLPNKIIEITPESRSELQKIVELKLKSDGGQTNYGKAFELTLQMFHEAELQLGVDSPHLTGPILAWVLTDGHPWPDELGNTKLDIMNWAKQIGATGNELWMIGVADADYQFLQEIVLHSQTGASNYYTSLEDVPKEFMEQATASRQTLWLDLVMETHDQLIYGLANAIEYARINLGVVVEIEINFALENPNLELEFLSGITSIKKDGQIVQVIIKRPNTLRLGQKLSTAFSLRVTDEILYHVRLQSINYRFIRGSKLLLEKRQILDRKLQFFIDVDSSKILGVSKVRNMLFTLKQKFSLHLQQLEDLVNTIEVLDAPEEEISNYKSQIQRLKEDQSRLKGLSVAIKRGK